VSIMSEAIEKAPDKAPEKAQTPPKTREQKRVDFFTNTVMLTRGAFHAIFTFALYFAWAEVASHLLPPHHPIEFLSLLGVTFVTFFGWVSGIDIITNLLRPWNLIQHPRVNKVVQGRSDKTEHKNT
jgi:hypothetical protein